MPIAPVTGTISHKFGEDRRTRRHNGIDYPVDKSTPVEASESGVVVRATYHAPTEKEVIGKKGKKEKKFKGSYGNVIIIYHGHNVKTRTHLYTLYAHLDNISVRVGDVVNQGDVIGTSGRSGTRQGFYNHKGGYELHFEVIESSTELEWVKTGNLDHYFANEDKRIDPEWFLFRPFGVSSRSPVPYYKLPVGLNFKKNIEEAKKMNKTPDDIISSIPIVNIPMKMVETLQEGPHFANAVRPNGKWDMRHTYGKSGLTREELTNLGNYNYGLTGAAAGYSSSFLHRMAGILQLGTGKWKREYGLLRDNPKDTYWIDQGIKDYRTGIWK